MPEEKSWQEMGIPDDELFTLEALEYWKQISPDEFLASVFHEGSPLVSVMKGYLELLDEHVDLESIPLTQGYTAQVAYDALWRSSGRLWELFQLMHHYWGFLENQKKARNSDNSE